MDKHNGEAVAVVGPAWTLAWAGTPLAKLCRDNPSLRIGSKLYLAPHATSGLVEARDEGFSDGVILALQIMTSAGDMGSHDYHELLTSAGAVKVYKRAEAEGMLELSGLSEYVKMEGHRPADEFRAALAAHDARGGK